MKFVVIEDEITFYSILFYVFKYLLHFIFAYFIEIVVVPTSETFRSAVDVHFMGNFIEVTIHNLVIGGEADEKKEVLMEGVALFGGDNFNGREGK